MNNYQSEQALERGILNDVWRRLGKSFVTPLTCCGLLLIVPQAAVAVEGALQLANAPTWGQEEGAITVLLEQQLRLRPATMDEAVSLFYLARAYRPVWDQPQRAQALLAAVGAVGEHGLDPADFRPAALRTAATTDPMTLPPAQRAERELLLSDTLAELLRQIRYGKLDPRSLYREWNFSPTPNPYERAFELAGVLHAPDLRAAIDAHAPDLALYRALQGGLAKYRALAALGDWPKVPTGPTLRPGERSVRVAALRARLQADGELLRDAADPNRYDEALVAAVRRFQARHGMEIDGVIGRQTLAALNASPGARADQIRANLERLRWVAQDLQQDRLLVDITGYHADLRLGGETVWASRVIVGKPTRKTPSLRDSVVNLVFNPKWVVPPTILREDVIPGVVRNPGYLASHRMRVVDRSGQTVDPQAIDWASARSRGFPYSIVQASGADGSLGRIKFSLSNRYAIYLHDTNARSLFRRAERALSSGCVRVENPAELALLLLDNPLQWSAETLKAALDSGRSRTVGVGRDVTVLLHYSTASLDEAGTLQLRNDIYDYDPAIVAALDSPVRSGLR